MYLYKGSGHFNPAVMSSTRAFTDSIVTRLKSLNPSTVVKDDICAIISEYESNANLLLPHQRACILRLLEPFKHEFDKNNEMSNLAVENRNLDIKDNGLECDFSMFQKQVMRSGIYSNGNQVESVDQLTGNVLIESIHEMAIDISTPLTGLTLHNCQDMSINVTVSGAISLRSCSNVTLRTISNQLRLSGCNRMTLNCMVKTPIVCEECNDVTSLNADAKFIHL